MYVLDELIRAELRGGLTPLKLMGEGCWWQKGCLEYQKLFRTPVAPSPHAVAVVITALHAL